LIFQAALEFHCSQRFFVTSTVRSVWVEKLSTASDSISPKEYCSARSIRDESFDSDIRFAPTSRWFDLEVAWASAPFDDFQITKIVPAMCAGSDVSVLTILAVCAIRQTASEKEQEPDMNKK